MPDLPGKFGEPVLPKRAQKRTLRGKSHNGETPWTSRWKPLGAATPCQDAFHRHGRAVADRAGADARRAARPAGAAAALVVADNEARFEAAISADFGHRCAIETTIAETMMVFSEIRHAAKHLKSWMAPQRVADRAAVPARAQPPDAAAARRRRHHRAVELSAAAHAGAGGRRDRRRQPRHDQAERTGAAISRRC